MHTYFQEYAQAYADLEAMKVLDASDSEMIDALQTIVWDKRARFLKAWQEWSDQPRKVLPDPRLDSKGY